MKHPCRKPMSKKPAFVILTVLMLMVIAAGCAKKKNTPVVHTISYRYASAEEGSRLLLENKEYYAGFSQNDLDFKMQKTGAGMDEYLAHSKDQVRDFTKREKKLIDECFEDIEKTLAKNNYTLPQLDEIVLIKTTMEEEPGAGAYTHGTQIYLGEQFLIHLARNPILEKDSFITILWHELFHCLTRCNPDFRTGMYSLINFTVVEDDFALPASVFEYHISNPDVEHHNAYATFHIDGKDIDCFTDFITTMHYDEAQSDFFDCGTTALVPIDGTDTYYTPEQADNFDEIFGLNTGYVIDPEECLADNFALAMHYGMDGEEGEGYNTPEIIEGIIKYVSATPQNESAAREQESAVPEQESALLQQAYVHPEDGYYCLLEDGVEYELRNQVAGTCWICSSSCAMITGYQLKNEGTIGPFDQLALVDTIFDKDENGGVSGGGKDSGGVACFAINELSQGFSDGYVLDGAIEAKDWSMEEYKQGIQKYGALYIGIPDTHKYYNNNTDGYTTLNWPDAEPENYDHSIAVIGWDDHFPKEYFTVEASRDGAWITYNSNRSGMYYYVSYDTPFDQVNDLPYFMSVSTEYAKVLTHDSGRWTTNTAGEGEITTANVFREEGTLSAVGTFVTADDSNLTIQIMTPDLKEVLYSKEYHADHAGYAVFKLDTPMDVKEYAIAVTYPQGAPVEGESVNEDWVQIETFSDEGESFIRMGDEWLDLSKKTTWDKLGFTTNNACIRALYVMI